MEEDLDRLESENHDLRQEVQHQRQPKPTKYDKLQLEFDGLRSELYISRERSESLEERVKFLESEQAPDHERETDVQLATEPRSAACAHPETNGWASIVTSRARTVAQSSVSGSWRPDWMVSEHTPLDIEGGLKDMPLIDYMSPDERRDFQYRVDIGDTVGAFEILLKFFASFDSPLGNLLREMEANLDG